MSSRWQAYIEIHEENIWWTALPPSFIMFTMFAITYPSCASSVWKWLLIEPQSLLCLWSITQIHVLYVVFWVCITHHKMEILVTKVRCALIRACALIRRNTVLFSFCWDWWPSAFCHNFFSDNIFLFKTQCIFSLRGFKYCSSLLVINHSSLLDTMNTFFPYYTWAYTCRFTSLRHIRSILVLLVPPLTFTPIVVSLWACGFV